MHRAFLDTVDGQIHYVTAGSGPPVLLLHQTPRSWDEYRDVIPLLARERLVIAMDTIGYGDSYKPARTCEIEDYARGAIALLDGLGVGSTAVIGHHTGSVIAMELAASYPPSASSGSCSPRARSSTRPSASGAGPAGTASTTSSRSQTARTWPSSGRGGSASTRGSGPIS